MNHLSRLDRLALDCGMTPTELRWVLLERVDRARIARDRLLFQDDKGKKERG